MPMNYNKLWKLMIDKNLSKTELTHLAGISTNAMAKLGRNEDVRVNVLEKLCTSLNCKLDVYRIVPTKNSKGRTIKPATAVMDLLKRQKAIQAEMRLKAGTAWENNDFVFTNECGHHFDNSTIYRAFKKAAAAIGRPDARFHDLRHSYAVAAIQSGDDIKTVQSNLGHATAAFTLDVYGHVTEQMKQASSERMDNFIKSVSGGKK